MNILEHRAYISDETKRFLGAARNDPRMSRTKVYKWNQMFEDGRTDILS